MIVLDRFIREEHQIRNFVKFCHVITPEHGLLELKLVTYYTDYQQKVRNTKKFEKLKNDLLKIRIRLDFEFVPQKHDRWIKADTNWKINMGKGLDIYENPIGDFLSQTDEEFRKVAEDTDRYVHDELI